MRVRDPARERLARANGGSQAPLLFCTELARIYGSVETTFRELSKAPAAHSTGVVYWS
jgi:hypothetical protein